MTTSHRASRAPAARGRIRVATAVLGLGIALSGALPWLHAGSAQASAVTDGSDWGSAGTLSSNSAVTVRWDNTGNPSADVVRRDGRQVIPHSGGHTYDDVTAATATEYATDFSNLAVTLSQTTGLVNQALTVKISGARQGTSAAGQNSVDYFQVFQCWGGISGDGRPDLHATQPDPATCQVGAVGPDSRGPSTRSETRSVAGDPLAALGDWQSYYNADQILGTHLVPFTAIDGELGDGDAADAKDKFFSPATTNELSNVTVGSAGSTTRQFEAQTTLESSGLGCGVSASSTSTSTCWLVVVPRIDDLNGLRSAGPISPSLWAQRLQVKLTFSDVQAGCPNGQSRTLFGGSEVLLPATASWTPALCDARGIAVGHTRLGDQTARNQFLAGASPAILTSSPVPPTVPSVGAPVALTAPVIAYQIAYNPACFDSATPVETDARAQQCGYSSLADARTEFAKAGTPITSLRLDARLVAKLLTQSYSDSILQSDTLPMPAWGIRSRPSSLLYDPEFRRLNSSLSHLAADKVGAIDHLVVEGLRSDASAQVWTWILADADGSAFINGCPDPDGMTVNPFYSTRTYHGCDDQKATLTAQADNDRAGTTKATTYVDQPLSYPPDGSPFPLPSWQELRQTGYPIKTVVDQLPPVDNLSATGRNVGIGHTPRNSLWCENDGSVYAPQCGLPPGKWNDNGIRQRSNQVGVAGITDAATAARWRLPTAQLCDSTGVHCVGADTTTLTNAASRFTTDPQGWLEPGAADYPADAYPMAMPVYAAVSPSLPLAQRQAYADAIDYITTTGQSPGFDRGDLPPGYAPITPAMRAQAVAAISQLRASSPSPSPSPSTSSTHTTGHHQPHPSTPSAPGAPAQPGPVVANPPGAAVPTVTVPTTPPGTQVTAADRMVTVSSVSEAGPSYLVPLGLVIALLAGFAGPAMRLWGRLQVTR